MRSTLSLGCFIAAFAISARNGAPVRGWCAPWRAVRSKLRGDVDSIQVAWRARLDVD